MSRIVNMKLLQDGTGRVCIHWLIEGDGPIAHESKANLRAAAGQGPKVTGRIACNPEQNTIMPQIRGNEHFLCCHSNDVRAATCPKCLATPEAIAMIEHYAQSVDMGASFADASQVADLVKAQMGNVVGPGVAEKTASKVGAI